MEDTSQLKKLIEPLDRMRAIQADTISEIYKRTFDKKAFLKQGKQYALRWYKVVALPYILGQAKLAIKEGKNATKNAFKTPAR